MSRSDIPVHYISVVLGTPMYSELQTPPLGLSYWASGGLRAGVMGG
jgi:hypothetical protein